MIGGNIVGELQLKTSEKNAIGESVLSFETIHSINGFLDLSSGDAKYTNYDAKIQESTHVFVCDYLQLDKRIKAENSRMVVDGNNYDVTLIDDPMNLHQHLEIYLKFTGGQ